jgi:hypothetical protein
VYLCSLSSVMNNTIFDFPMASPSQTTGHTDCLYGGWVEMVYFCFTHISMCGVERMRSYGFNLVRINRVVSLNRKGVRTGGNFRNSLDLLGFFSAFLMLPHSHVDCGTA